MAVILTLALGSAVLHVAWNAAARAEAGRLRYIWLLTLGGGVGGLILALPSLGRLDFLRLWPWLLATWVIHALYFTALGRAYRESELAWAYTLSRAFGVLLGAAAALIFFGQRLHPLAWLGLGIVLLGSLLASGPRGKPRALWLVLCIGLSIAGYSLVDSRGVLLAPPIDYIALLYLGAAALVAPFALREPPKTGDLKALPYGLVSLASYLMMLYAYRLGPLAPSLAVRQAAPVVAALWGYLFLRERPRAQTVYGAVLVAAGAALLSLY